MDPALGGSVLGLWLGGTPVLRPTLEAATHAGQSAAYPLVPYSNRIGRGQMDWRGERYSLRNGFNGEAHALHGVGFMRPWTVVEQQVATLVLRLVHAPDEFWPFAFEAEQRFELGPDGLRLTMSARNSDARVQPMGLGWHPYFVRRSGSALDLPVMMFCRAPPRRCRVCAALSLTCGWTIVLTGLARWPSCSMPICRWRWKPTAGIWCTHQWAQRFSVPNQ